MKFLIIHGSFGSPQGNWFAYLENELKKLGQDVLVPQFPVDEWDEVIEKGEEIPTNKQNLTNWLETFEKEVIPWISKEKVVVAAHSLGPLFALHAVSKYKISLDSAVFVSPFLDIPRKEDAWPIDLANKTFYKHNFDYVDLKIKIPVSYVLYSGTDPYVPTKYVEEFASKTNSALIQIKGGKHLSSEFKNNEFPLVLELCKSRIDLSEY